MVKYARHAMLAVLALCLLWGCASLTPELDPPTINVVSFKSLPSDDGAPRFQIKLRVLNPNKQTLDIAGISYSVALLDRELITGVSNDISPIAGYSEGVVTLDAQLQLMELVQLMTSLGSAGSRPLAYRFTAKIDFNGFIPTQRIEETGEIKLH